MTIVRGRSEARRVRAFPSLFGLVALAALSLSLAGAAADAVAATNPVTHAVTPAPIEELAVTRRHLAWASYWPSEEFGTVWAQDIRTRERTRLSTFGQGFSLFRVRLLGFAGGRGVWSAEYGDLDGEQVTWEGDVSTASVGDRRVRTLGVYYADMVLADADRAPLVYAPLYLRVTNWDECSADEFEPPWCEYEVDGDLRRVVHGRLTFVGGVPVPALFSAHRGRLAVVPADSTPIVEWWELPIPTPAVELRRLLDGSLVHRIELGGVPRAVSLSRGFLTVLVTDDTGQRTIERYGPDAVPLGITSVPAGTTRVESDGASVAFSVGREIRAIDGATGSVRTLRVARTPPIDLQTIGGRVYWAANGRGHGRVLSLPLPTG